MNYDFKIIEEKFKQLPEDIQLALSSTAVTNDIQKIAADNGLLINQESVLYDLVGYVLLGLVKSSDFVKTFSKEAGVSTKVAMAIAKTINDNVFSKIRSSIQKIEHDREVPSEQNNDTKRQDLSVLEPSKNIDQADSTISSVESVGDFDIDRPSSILESSSGITAADRAKILAGVEDAPKPAIPNPVVPKPVPPSTPPAPPKAEVSDPKPDDPYKEPLN